MVEFKKNLRGVFLLPVKLIFGIVSIAALIAIIIDPGNFLWICLIAYQIGIILTVGILLWERWRA